MAFQWPVRDPGQYAFASPMLTRSRRLNRNPQQGLLDQFAADHSGESGQAGPEQHEAGGFGDAATLI